MIARLTVIVAWIAGILVSLAVIAGTRFSTDMSAFLPRSPGAAEQILVDQLREGVVSRLILVAIEGGEPDTMAALSKAMAHRLRGAPGSASSTTARSRHSIATGISCGRTGIC